MNNYQKLGLISGQVLMGQGRLRDLKRYFGQSVVGLMGGLLMFYYFFLAPGRIDNFFTGLLSYLAPVIPLIGAIIGFNVGLINRPATEATND